MFKFKLTNGMMFGSLMPLIYFMILDKLDPKFDNLMNKIIFWIDTFKYNNTTLMLFLMLSFLMFFKLIFYLLDLRIYLKYLKLYAKGSKKYKNMMEKWSSGDLLYFNLGEFFSYKFSGNSNYTLNMKQNDYWNWLLIITVILSQLLTILFMSLLLTYTYKVMGNFWIKSLLEWYGLLWMYTLYTDFMVSFYNNFMAYSSRWWLRVVRYLLVSPSIHFSIPSKVTHFFCLLNFTNFNTISKTILDSFSWMMFLPPYLYVFMYSVCLIKKGPMTSDFMLNNNTYVVLKYYMFLLIMTMMLGLLLFF